MNKKCFNLVNFNEKSILNFRNEFIANTPFKNVIIDDFFNKEYLLRLKKELEKEKYYRESHDLYEFLRTVDFRNLDNKIIKEFRELIFSKEFINIIQEISQIELKNNIIELHSLRLQNGDYLLCHDDMVQKRKIAFIIYLSEVETGGELELFGSNNGNPNEIVKKIKPKFNRFAMFEVSNKSFHQIKEVEGKLERLSISGWFY